MKTITKMILFLGLGFSLTSCVSKKKLTELQTLYEKSESNLVTCGDNVQDYKDRLNRMSRMQQESENQKNNTLGIVMQRDMQINELKMQIIDFKGLRDKQLDAVGNLTVLSKEANANIDKTLSQLATKDRYIYLLQAARTKTDSINLALAVNLTSVLRIGIEDKDVEIKVDKTVVFINISDKMLFSTGSTKISARANSVLEKIALIIKSRPELEVMVEGYTDDVSINTECVTNNWDLSAKRATSFIRVKQHNFISI
jgi:chemotaxis protein MotB